MMGPFTKKDHLTISTLGVEFAVAVALGTAGGFWADRTWGTGPWLLIIGMMAGFGLGLYIIIGAARKLDAEQLSQAEKPPKAENTDGHR